MRLGPRILFYIFVSCAIPLVAVGIAAEQAARSRLEDRVIAFQVQSAQALAADVARVLTENQRMLSIQLSNFRLENASTEARVGFLFTTCRLFSEVSALLLLDGAGNLVAPAAVRGPDGPELLPDGVDVPRLRANLPAPGAAGEVRVGAPYLPPGSTAAVVPMTLTSIAEPGIALGAGLSLEPVTDRLFRTIGPQEVALFGADGTVLLRSGTSGLIEAGRYTAVLQAPAADLRYRTDAGVLVLAATAQVPQTNWMVVVAERGDAVEAAATELRHRIWFIAGISYICALVIGGFLTRSVTVPILRLRRAARQVGQGEFSRRVPVEGRDEIADLSAAFNQMSYDLGRSTAEIASKNAEIEAFNAKLQARVERRTAQLKETQARLVQSGQLAAIAEVASGVAHELNNPLAGILGVVQIVAHQRAGQPEEALLRAAEEQALRCKEIIASLLRFTRDPSPAAGGTAELSAVLPEVLSLVAGAFRQRAITVESALTPPLEVNGDAAVLGRAFGQLLTALRAVAAPASTLRVESVRKEREICLVFAISHTLESSDDWLAAGLNFWVARQVLQEHGATLEEPQSRGGPRSWTLRMPDRRAGPAAEPTLF